MQAAESRERRYADLKALMLSHFITYVVIPTGLSAGIIGILGLLERFLPAVDDSQKSFLFNVKYLFPYYALQAVTLPFILGATVWLIDALGGGFLILPASGAGLIWGIAVFTLTMDFGEYLFHVAQHKIPILWSLHSLHHSDRSLNTSTTLRHFWGDQLLKAVTIYSVAGLLLRPNPVIVAAYSVISYYNFFSHMNVKIGLGRFSWLINSPQYHRLHHSIRRHDYDLRYAALFPIFDILCGTYRAPEKGDFPHTGLAEISEPDSVLEAIIWPVRRRENTLRAIEK